MANNKPRSKVLENTEPATAQLPVVAQPAAVTYRDLTFTNLYPKTFALAGRTFSPGQSVTLRLYAKDLACIAGLVAGRGTGSFVSYKGQPVSNCPDQYTDRTYVMRLNSNQLTLSAKIWALATSLCDLAQVLQYQKGALKGQTWACESYGLYYTPVTASGFDPGLHVPQPLA